MKELLSQIKNLAQEGMEQSIVDRNKESKEIFLEILLKAEVALNKSDAKPVATFSTSTGRKHDKISDEARHNLNVVAYAFSEYKHTMLYPLVTQQEAFYRASQKLGVKKNTLSAKRDAFDGHNDNHRKGWWRTPLAPDMQLIKDEYDKKSKDEVLADAREILGIKE